MKDILNFLAHPDNERKAIFKKSDDFKKKSIIILLILHWFSIPIFHYISNIGIYVNGMYYFKLFFYSIIIEIVFVTIVYWTWKLLEWKAKFLDVFFISMVCQLVYILVSVFLLALLFAAPPIMFLFAPFLIIMAFFWYLIAWLYWISYIEKLSKLKLLWVIIIAELVCFFADYIACFILSIKLFK